jgi:hypothetical protein
MKVFIIMYNRLTWPIKMCEFLSNTGCEVILIDNNSTYPPLLEWYKSCPYELWLLEKNEGHFGPWKTGIIDRYTDRYYIVTDHDLDLSMVPPDYVSFLKKGLDNNPDVVKSGLSLRIDDLPDNPFAKEAHDWELKFWQTPRDRDGFYQSTLDTTFALYDRERGWGEFPGGSPSNDKFFSAVRAPSPYTARHLLWYETKESIANNEEELYYHNNTGTYWSEKLKELL